jgi:hypothetical protein
MTLVEAQIPFMVQILRFGFMCLCFGFQLIWWIWICYQVDVEVSFDLPRLEIAEFEEETGENSTAQQLCSRMGSAARTIGGPFGLLVLASKDLNERTAVFFQIVRYRNELKLLMCSDQSR